MNKQRQAWREAIAEDKRRGPRRLAAARLVGAPVSVDLEMEAP